METDSGEVEDRAANGPEQTLSPDLQLAPNCGPRGQETLLDAFRSRLALNAGSRTHSQGAHHVSEARVTPTAPGHCQS
jgi:hypothetical protein